MNIHKGIPYIFAFSFDESIPTPDIRNVIQSILQQNDFDVTHYQLSSDVVHSGGVIIPYINEAKEILVFTHNFYVKFVGVGTALNSSIIENRIQRALDVNWREFMIYTTSMDEYGVIDVKVNNIPDTMDVEGIKHNIKFFSGLSATILIGALALFVYVKSR